MSLLFLDIDYFKKINDTYGHDAGDYVLKKTTKIIHANIRDEDIFARWGGEEFALLLPETEIADAVIVAKRIRKIIEETSFRYCKKKLSLTISIGISNIKKLKKRSISELVKNADTALYKAKHNGRNRVVF